MYPYYATLEIEGRNSVRVRFYSEVLPTHDNLDIIKGDACVALYENIGDEILKHCDDNTRITVKVSDSMYEQIGRELFVFFINNEYCPIDMSHKRGPVFMEMRQEEESEPMHEITLQVRFKESVLNKIGFTTNMDVLGGELVALDFTGKSFGGNE